MLRPLPLSLAFGALMVVLLPARALAAPAPVAEISPELTNVRVDSADFRAATTRLETTTAQLNAATALVASTADELDALHREDARLTTELASATARKKQATVTLARTRGSLRALATDSYVHDRPDPVLDDLDAATTLLDHQTMRRAISDDQLAQQHAAGVAYAAAVSTLRTDLVARTTIRQRTLDTQAAHDGAVADEARLAVEVVARQQDLDRARVMATVVGEDFTLVALDAYWRAAHTMEADDPKCGIPWWALSGIARVESRHGTYGGAQILANGDEDRVIVGIPLDGTDDTQVIADTDGGAFDGDPDFDHAVGPMQFIPSTWRRWAPTRQASPNNIYDATLGAARYLCANGPMQTDEQLRRGFLRYNQSETYADDVLRFAKAYSAFVPPPPTPVGG